MSNYDPGKNWPPDQWLVEDMFLSGGKINFILGWANVGKSRLLAWLIANMLAGTKPFGLKCTNPPQKILWLRGEETERNIQWRLTRYAQLLGADPTAWSQRIRFVAASEMGLEREDKRDALLQLTLEEECSLLAADPMRRLHGAKESSSDDMGRLNNALRKWTDRYGFDILMVHHTGKLNEDVDMDNINAWARGSSDIAAILDSAIFLQRLGGEGANADSDIQILRAGRHAPSGEAWKVRDYGRDNKDDPIKTDLGFSRSLI